MAVILNFQHPPWTTVRPQHRPRPPERRRQRRRRLRQHDSSASPRPVVLFIRPLATDDSTSASASPPARDIARSGRPVCSPATCVVLCNAWLKAGTRLCRRPPRSPPPPSQRAKRRADVAFLATPSNRLVFSSRLVRPARLPTPAPDHSTPQPGNPKTSRPRMRSAFPPAMPRPQTDTMTRNGRTALAAPLARPRVRSPYSAGTAGAGVLDECPSRGGKHVPISCSYRSRGLTRMPHPDAAARKGRTTLATTSTCPA